MFRAARGAARWEDARSSGGSGGSLVCSRSSGGSHLRLASRGKASNPPGVAPDRGTASRAKPGMASQLGLESIPVEEEYLHSWKTLGTEWVRRRVRPAVPEALDTGAVEGECHLFVQDKRMADRTEESVYFGVGERPSPAGADAAAREELAERAPQIWRWLARAQTQIASPSVANAWVTTALVKPPPRTRSLTFGAKSVAARRKNLLYTVKNKSKQEIDLTHEGEALVDHLALNALLLRHAKEKISNEGMYVTIAGVEPGWEGRELHFAAAARCNALGENLGLDPDGRPPVTMLSAPRMPYTVVRDDYPSHIWHLVFVVPPPTGAGPTRLMKRNEQLVSDLAEAMSFSRRTGTRLGVVGVELEGTHNRRAAAAAAAEAGTWEVHDPATLREIEGADAKETRWRLQRDDLVGAVEEAARRRASAEALDHRRRVQEFWLEDWTHEGLTLHDAAEMVGNGNKSAAWAREWFAGYCEPYLSPRAFSAAGVARAWNVAFGDKNRRRGKAYIARNVTPLMNATRRFLDHELSEMRLLEELAEENAEGWAVAGARAALERRKTMEEGGDTRDGGWGFGGGVGGFGGAGRDHRAHAHGSNTAGKLTAAQQAQRDAEAAAAAAADAARSEEFDHGDDPELLFREFQHFRDNVDLMTMRDAADADAHVFNVLLDDIERRGRERGALDVTLAPLHAVAVEFIVKQLEVYREKMMDQTRTIRLTEEDGVNKRCYDLLLRAERQRQALDGARRAYVAATDELVGVCDNLERGVVRGDFDALAGTDEATTFDVGQGDAPFSSTAWSDKLQQLHAKEEALSAFEGEVTEETRLAWRDAAEATIPRDADQAEDDAETDSSSSSSSSSSRDTSPAVVAGRAAPTWYLTHENLCEDITLDLEGALRFFRDLTFANFLSSRDTAGDADADGDVDVDADLVDADEAKRVHDDWTRLMASADDALRRAYELRGKIAAAVDLIAATDKIDPSGIRAAIERARAAGAPPLTVQAAESKLADLEAEIAAFIRHRRAGESLLPPPKKSWTGAGRHIWYDEGNELGRGSLGTAVYAGVYDEAAGSSSVVRRPAAIKRIPLPPGERGQSVRALVEREVALHRHLNQNSNRVTFLLGTHMDGTDAVFTAMERCGESLAQWLRDAPGGRVTNLSPGDRLGAAEALTAAVADVHAAGVTHNDIKPDNCLRAASGEFKLADLGLGVRLKNADRGKDDQYSMTTFAGYGVNVQLQGRPPEVLQGLSLTSAVDVWSLGNLIFTVFTGSSSPYRDEDVSARGDGKRGKGSGGGGGGGGGGGEAGLQGLYENQRIIRGNFSLRALETSKLPRHTVAAARQVLHDMLQPDPADRPTAAQVLAHPMFWSPERAVEKIRSVHDEKLIPLHRAGSRALTPEEEMDLVASAVEARLHGKGTKSGGKSKAEDARVERESARVRALASRLSGWKDLVIPELLDRVTKHNIKRTYAAASPEQLQRAKDEAREATEQAAAAKGDGTRRKGRKRGGSLRAAAARGDWDGTGYEPTLRDLFRFVRNIHEHPGLQQERFAMVRALGSAGTHLLRSDGEDGWGAARRVVEAYVAHTFPELPLLAHALLTPEGREAADTFAGASRRR